MKRKCDHEGNEVKDEKHKFSLCRRQFGLHLMLEQYNLRKMNAGEHCVLSEMMSTCDMTREEKQWFRQDRSLKRVVVFRINMRFTEAGIKNRIQKGDIGRKLDIGTQKQKGRGRDWDSKSWEDIKSDAKNERWDLPEKRGLLVGIWALWDAQEVLLCQTAQRNLKKHEFSVTRSTFWGRTFGNVVISGTRGL